MKNEKTKLEKVKRPVPDAAGQTLTWPSPSVPEMTPDRWRQVQWLFDAVLSRKPAERAAFLEQTTAEDPTLHREVASLIRSLEEASQFIEEPAGDRVKKDDAEVFALGTRVGAYRLVRLLGSGGVGRVYLADRADRAFEMQVAVKVLKRGMDTDELVRRFVSERQILARLEHPNISKLLDGGATEDGRPFLVMEYVDGVPLNHWCAERQLDVPARLELFLSVCDAVQFAHRNLVIHRDLKPGNILVATGGVVKLLDFGIAKLLAPESFPETVLPTVPGWRAMTPEYASPEQVLGEVVTTASDVYSLGVVLYQLLTGHRPYRITEPTPRAVERAVCHTEPPKASKRVRDAPGAASDAPSSRALERLLAGDLDDILSMALEKEPEKRYGTVDQLAADVRRHLSGLPVMARKQTFLYRAGKFVRRHTLPVAVSALILLLLMSFLVTLWVQRGQILRQQSRAELVSGFLVDIFAISDPSHERGATITARELLDKGTRDVEARLRDQPGMLGDLLATMGTSYKSLGFYTEAERLLERSLALRTAAYGSSGPAVASSKQLLANLYFNIGEIEEAERYNREALDRRLTLYGNRHPEVAESHFRLALIRQQQSDVTVADSFFAEAEGQARELGLDDLLIRTLSRRGALARFCDDAAAARPLLEEALALAEQVWGETHPEVALILNQLAELEKNYDLGRARSLFSRALTIQRAVYHDPHKDVAHVLNNLAILDERQGRLKEAEAGYREVLALRQAINPDQGAPEASVLNNLAGLALGQGRIKVAEELFLKSLDIYRRRRGPRHEETANVLNNLGQIYQLTGRADEAEAHFRDVLDILVETFGEEHGRVAIVHSNLANLAMARGDFDQAAEGFELARRILQALSPTHTKLPTVLQNEAFLAGKRGDAARSEVLYGQALEILAALGEGEGLNAANIYTNRTVGRLRAEDPVAAEEWARRAVAIYERSLSPDSSEWLKALRARRYLVMALTRQERFAEAEPLAEENLEACRRQRVDGRETECAQHMKALTKLQDRWKESLAESQNNFSPR